jgi:hypothetical protein
MPDIKKDMEDAAKVAPKDAEPPPPSTDLAADWRDLQAKPFALERMSDADLRKFIQDYLGNMIFTSAHIRPIQQTMLGQIFMPILFGAFEDYREQDLEQIGIIYEYYNKAGPMSINGYPMFVSMRLLHALDWERARKVIIQEEQRAKELELPPDEG